MDFQCYSYSTTEAVRNRCVKQFMWPTKSTRLYSRTDVQTRLVAVILSPAGLLMSKPEIQPLAPLVRCRSKIFISFIWRQSVPLFVLGLITPYIIALRSDDDDKVPCDQA